MKTRSPTLPPSSFRIVATLDMTHEVERDTQAFLQRACTGRWPMWRLFGMRRHGDILAICVQWLRCRDTPYALVEVSLNRPALCWRYFPTAAAASAALAALDAQPTRAHTPAAATTRMAG